MDKEEIREIINAELDNRLGTPLTPEEKMQEARDSRDIFRDGRQFAEQRSEEVADEFIRLEVQISALIFTVTGFIVSSFVKGGSLDGFWMKLAICVALISLVLSLVMGMLQLKRVEWFWDFFLRQRDLRFREWRKVARKETTFEEAMAFERGTALERGNIILTPRWGWILQTVFLGIGVGILLILFVNYIFAGSEMVQSTSSITSVTLKP